MYCGYIWLYFVSWSFYRCYWSIASAPFDRDLQSLTLGVEHSRGVSVPSLPDASFDILFGTEILVKIKFMLENLLWLDLVALFRCRDLHLAPAWLYFRRTFCTVVFGIDAESFMLLNFVDNLLLDRPTPPLSLPYPCLVFLRVLPFFVLLFLASLQLWLNSNQFPPTG